MVGAWRCVGIRYRATEPQSAQGKSGTRPKGKTHAQIRRMGHPTWRYMKKRASWYSLGSDKQDYIGVMAMVARVFSHSMRKVQSLAPLSKAIAKFSTGLAVLYAFMSARCRSISAPG